MPRGSYKTRSTEPAPGSSPVAPTFEGCVNVQPGAARTAAVQALIVAGEKFLCFGEGDYNFEGPVFAGLTEAQVSGVQLVGAGDGRTRFHVSYAPAVGLVDDPTQALLFYDGAPDGVVATTVAAGIAAQYGAITFTPTSTVGMVPGMRLRLRAHNAPGLPTDASGMSDGVNVVLTEMVQVLSIAAGVVTLTSPLQQWHTPGAAVDSVQPVTNVLVRGIYFDFSGAGASTVSNAIYSRCTDGIEVDGCWFRSFPRTGCEFGPGSRNVRATRGRGKGLLNGLLFGDSCTGGLWEDWQTDTDVERVHTLGIPRHFVFCQERCVGIQRRHFRLAHGSAGVCDYGGWSNSLEDYHAWDMDDAPIRARNPLYGALGFVGLGYESGAGPLGNESFAFDLSMDEVHLYNLFGTDFSWPVFWHDIIDGTIGKMTIANKGPVYGTVINGITYRMLGFLSNDMQGASSIGELVCSGVSFGWQSYGGASIEVGLYRFDGGAGNGGSSVALYIDNATVAPQFDRVVISNCNGNRLLFGPQFAIAPDFNFRIREYQIDFFRFSGARLSRNNDIGPVAFLVGEGVVFDPASAAGELGCLTPAGAAVDAVVCVGGPTDVGTGLIMVAPLPEGEMWVQATAAAVVPGSRMVGSGAGLRTFVAAAPPNAFYVGSSLRPKAAGAAGMIPIGPSTSGQ